ncbi:MAG: DNA translocase FtsK 4TM domain-containing protein, partial [Candidatus Kapaibacterium sp.]
MPQDYEREDSPHIRISRNGSVTRFGETAAGAPRYYEDDAPFEEAPAGTPAPREAGLRERPMPKRLSEEAREAQEAERRARMAVYEEPIVKVPRKRAAKKAKAAEQEEPEQIPLPLKAPRAKPDAMVRQRQVLGFSCVVMAILVLLAIISYSPDDASRAETKISDLPALFLPHGNTPDPVREAVRASADQAKNWLGLIGAMLANFLINKTIGFAAILYPIFFGAWSLAFFRFTYKQRRRLTLATTFFLLTAVLFSATMGTLSNFLTIPREWSGSVGQFLGLAFTRAIGGAGAFIIYAAAFIIMLIFSIDLDIEKTFHRLHGWWTALVLWSRRKIIEFWEKREARQALKAERRAAEEALEERMKDEGGRVKGEAERTKDEGIEQEIIPDTIDSGERKAEGNEAISELVELNVGPIRPLSPIGLAQPTSLTAVLPEAPVEEPAQTKVRATPLIVPGQPLLKVRPAQKHEGAGIPRLTRNGQERLGSRAMHFSRLTNGAVEHEEKRTEPPVPVAVAEAPELQMDTIIPEQVPAGDDNVSLSPEEASESFANIDTSEEMIEPLKRRVREAKNSLPPVLLGDEKVLANEALPHSVSVDVGLPLPIEARSIDIEPEGEDLFYEKGHKP